MNIAIKNINDLPEIYDESHIPVGWNVINC